MSPYISSEHFLLTMIGSIREATPASILIGASPCEVRADHDGQGENREQGRMGYDAGCAIRVSGFYLNIHKVLTGPYLISLLDSGLPHDVNPRVVRLGFGASVEQRG